MLRPACAGGPSGAAQATWPIEAERVVGVVALPSEGNKEGPCPEVLRAIHTFRVMV